MCGVGGRRVSSNFVGVGFGFAGTPLGGPRREVVPVELVCVVLMLGVIVIEELREAIDAVGCREGRSVLTSELEDVVSVG